MAAIMKEGGNGKGKRLVSPSNPPKTDVSQEIPTPTKKSTPNYLKPTISSSNEVCKCGSRHATSKHLPGMKSPVRPPSPSSIGNKDRPGRAKEKSLQPTSTSTKATVSKRPVSGRTPISIRNGTDQTLVKARIKLMESITKEIREEAKATRMNTTSSIKAEKPASAPREKEKEEQEDEVFTEAVKKEVVERSPLDVPPTEYESLCRKKLDSEAGASTASHEEQEEPPGASKEIVDRKGDSGELKNHHSAEEQRDESNQSLSRKNLNSQAGDSTASHEEQEEAPGATKEIMDGKGDSGEVENHHSAEEQGEQPNESLCRKNLDSEAGDSTASHEEQEEAPGATKVVLDRKGDSGKVENHHSAEEQREESKAGSGEVVQNSNGNSIASEQVDDDPDERKRINGRNSISMDSSGIDKPHKMQFQRGKVIGNAKTGDTESVRLKFRERGSTGFAVEDPKPETISVVLNHQDIQEKKEAAAYNDVIEQTASKLVEVRRSKVKALVGAFETVMSLQD